MYKLAVRTAPNGESQPSTGRGIGTAAIEQEEAQAQKGLREHGARLCELPHAEHARVAEGTERKQRLVQQLRAEVGEAGEVPDTHQPIQPSIRRKLGLCRGGKKDFNGSC